jgi:DNA-binding MarR family transcriptional regulator
MVTRTRSDVDRRVVEVELTDLGRSLLDTFRTRFQERWDDTVSGLDETDLAAAARVFGTLVHLFGPPS